MRYFCTVVEEGQVSRAARRLHMAQPPLSQRLRELEEEIGYPLLERQGRTLRVTDAGQVFYPGPLHSNVIASKPASTAYF